MHLLATGSDELEDGIETTLQAILSKQGTENEIRRPGNRWEIV
jgi:hypothetical protein